MALLRMREIREMTADAREAKLKEIRDSGKLLDTIRSRSQRFDFHSPFGLSLLPKMDYQHPLLLWYSSCVRQIEPT